MAEKTCCGECGRLLPEPREVTVEVEMVFRATENIKVVARTPKEAESMARQQAEGLVSRIYEECESYGINEDYEVASVDVDKKVFEAPPNSRKRSR